MALALCALVFCGQAIGQCPVNTNLIENPGGEELQGIPPQPWVGNQDHDVPVWADTPTSTYGQFTVIPYSLGGGFPTASSPGPPDRGLYFFSGGPANANSFGLQNENLDPSCFAAIDSGQLPYSVSGWFGGFAGQNDFANLLVTFLAPGNVVIDVVNIGSVSSADRGNTTGLLFRSSTGIVPVGTRQIQFRLQMTQQSGDNDGYADNLDFRFAVPTAAGVLVGGRVVDSSGRSVSGATVSLSGLGSGERIVMTNPFGFFRFEDVEAGQSYVVSVRHKWLTFDPRLISTEDSVDDLLIVSTGNALTNSDLDQKGSTRRP